MSKCAVWTLLLTVKVKEGKVFALHQKEVGFPGIVLGIFSKKIKREMVFLEKSLKKLL